MIPFETPFDERLKIVHSKIDISNGYLIFTTCVAETI